jgi:endonuclease/exonuclease/phosphatase family metal-dependent hydrolase
MNMGVPLLTRRHTIFEQQVLEPTVLAIALAVAAVLALGAILIVAIAGLPMLGYMGASAAMIAAALTTLLVLGLRRNRTGPPVTGRQRWFQRVVHAGRWGLAGLLIVWLALIIWLWLCPGGPEPAPKADPALIRVISWNIHCGRDDGLPWQQFDWPTRKVSLRSALAQAEPDILCVQEATPEQVAFLEETLPRHRRVGVGRDDGKSAGEHCAVYFHTERFDALADKTFWLEEPIDQPRPGNAFDVKRICTSVRLRDRRDGRTLRVYNTHLYLTEAPRLGAVELILADMAAGDRSDAVVLTGDFNASPRAPSRQRFLDSGLADSAQLAGHAAGQATFQLYGVGVSCIDGILVDPRWHVRQFRILDVKPHGTFPSDHFALVADLALGDRH